MTNQEIVKVGIFNLETKETLYPQIVQFIIWDENKIEEFNIQGLQSIQVPYGIYFCIDGRMQIHVLKGYTIEFEFQEVKNEEEEMGWVTAEIIPVSS